jgi:hypothetical protein
MKNIFTYCIVAFICLSCSTSTGDSATTETNDSLVAEIVTDVNIIVPEGIYATNTAAPTREFNIANVIDGNTSTHWKTPEGSGTDEGIMFSFSEPFEIGSIKVNTVMASGFAKVKAFSVYANGTFVTDRGTGNEALVLNKTVNSLFIRFGERDDKIKTSTYSDPENDESSYKQEYYSKEKCIGVSEIEFFDANGKKINVKSPILVDCKITASSVLKPVLAYSPDNLVDSKREFGWAEGVSGGGEFESVEFLFQSSVTITECKIWNGYQRSESHFENNNRAKLISLIDEKGNSQEFTLADSQEPQMIKCTNAIMGKKLTLKINSIYPGDKYNDMVISEIVFFSNGVPIKLFTEYEEKLLVETKKINNKQLDAILDRLIKTNFNSGESENFSTNSNSLIIRSNNTFVCYSDRFSRDNDYFEQRKSTITEGGWEFIETKGNSARIRIFGKMYESTSGMQPYVGRKENESTKIFQDFLTITDTSIVGDSFIEKISLQW